MGRKVIKKETAKIAEAFEYYYGLGDDRSYQKVAEQFHVSESTIFNYSSSFNWAERVMQRDMEISQRMREKNIKEIVDTKANYRKIIKLAVRKFVDGLNNTDSEGNAQCLIKVNSIQDLERLVKLDLVLMGEVADISQVNNNVSGQMAMSEADKMLAEQFIDVMHKELKSRVPTEEDEDTSEDEELEVATVDGQE